MSFLLWQRESDLAIASARLVLRADEVPQLLQAQQLRDELDVLRRNEAACVEAACAAAHAEGLASGLEQGRRDARDELAAAITALTQTVAHERASLRDDVAALALQVARKLMGQGSVDARLAALAAVAAREMLPAQALTLVVHPDRCAAVRAALAQRATSAASEPVPDFEVRGDDRCAADDCRIETELGSADASLETQLARLAAAWGVAETPVPAAARRAA